MVIFSMELGVSTELPVSKASANLARSSAVDGQTGVGPVSVAGASRASTGHPDGGCAIDPSDSRQRIGATANMAATRFCG